MSHVAEQEVVDPTVLSVVVTAFRKARLHLPEAWQSPFLVNFGDGSPEMSTDAHVIDHDFPAAEAYAVDCDGRTGYEFTVRVDDIGQNEGEKVVRFCPLVGNPQSVPANLPVGPEVPGPPYVGRTGTLLDVVPVTDSSDPTWTAGFVTRDPCPGDLGVTVGECIQGGIGPKEVGVTGGWDGWAPFAVYAYYACSPTGVTEQEARDAANGTLTAKQSLGVEYEVLTGAVRGSALGLLTLATDVGLFYVVDALAAMCGRFHQDNGDGQGVILVGVGTGTLLAANRAIERVSGRWTAPCGCPVVLSAALDETGTFPTQHLFHVGGMKVMAGPAFDLGLHVSDVNTRTFIVERTFGVAWNCDPVMATAAAITASS